MTADDNRVAFPHTHRLLSLESNDLAVVPDHPTEADLEPCRERIDALDRAILELLNDRMRWAHVIGGIKKKLGMPVYVPTREEEVLDNVTAANEGPIPDAAVRRLFERVIDETRSLERKKFKEDRA